MDTRAATLLVMTHGEGFGMVPITDRYNSRGGKYTGAYFMYGGNVTSNIAVEIRANRDLTAGEPITTEYYEDIPNGVPELLRDRRVCFLLLGRSETSRVSLVNRTN